MTSSDDDLSWLLRRELYNLKDELQRAIEQLSKIVSLQPSQQALVKDVIKTYQTVTQTVSMILSNHTSEWIESGIAGGLTYAEFMELDAGCIRDFTLQLERTLDDIERYSSGFRPVQDSFPSPFNKSEEGPLLLDEGRLDRLESLAQVLAATLNVGRN